MSMGKSAVMAIGIASESHQVSIHVTMPAVMLMGNPNVKYNIPATNAPKKGPDRMMSNLKFMPQVI